MSDLKSIDEMAQKAFALAYFLHGNRAKAICIVREALGKLEVAAAAQVKRLYYTPARHSLLRRTQPSNQRTKVTLSDLHLLQRLIYVESEPHEKEREQTPGALGEAELLIHFIKYLIRISIKRNSFYVALGVGRLLHNYSTTETMDIYNVVVQDPERVKDDYYYRSRKGRLIQEVKERFGDLVTVCRGPRGEERFQTLDAPDDFIELVSECLNQFSPWLTPCLIPAGYDPTADEIPTLSSARPGEEDKVEINRIHAVVHPGCYQQITDSLKLESPARRLSVPQFILPDGKNNMQGPKNRSRRPATSLDRDEMDSLKRGLREQSARRKATHASLLSFVVDKVERARLDLRRAGSVRLVVDDGAELVEVRARGGGKETLLAAHLLSGDEMGDFGGPARSEVVLEGGQRLTFELSTEHGGVNGEARTVLAVSYQETKLLRAASLSWRRLARRISAAPGVRSLPEGAFVRPALGALVLVVCAGALALYALRDARPRPPAELAADRRQPAAGPIEGGAPTRVVPTQNDGGSSEASAVSRGSAQDSHQAGRVEKPSRTGAPRAASTESGAPGLPRHQPALAPAEAGLSRTGSGAESPTAESSPRDSDTTRSVDSGAGATALSKVKKVFLDVSGEQGLSEQTSRLLSDRLRGSGRLIPTENRDEADAAFKIKVSSKPPVGKSRAGKEEADSDFETRLVTVSVRLVNGDGAVIWSPGGRHAKGSYTGRIKDLADRITKDLLKDVLTSDARE